MQSITADRNAILQQINIDKKVKQIMQNTKGSFY